MRLLSVLAVGAFALPLAAFAADPHSYAQPDQVRVTHLDLDLKVDFPHKQLDGLATLKLDWKNAKAQALVLDTRDLTISKVEGLDASGKASPLKFTLAERDKQLGSKLTIDTPKQPVQVRITYTTAPTASGLQWLTPEQTADKKLPFMFSQSESIHARSWVPLQDSPAIRFTYKAHVTAPKDVRVTMSAINDAKHPLDGDFSFEQPHPIPSYLLAIAAGDIAVKETGPRSAVYAEPSVVGKAAHEFEDTEKLIAATEKLYGPYAWGRYDILVLPPSFPFGGMENPNMTFATPTVLVGDKSLVSLVSHELAHSWSGNLVTSAAWRDIWLNEGFTTYVQGRITEAVYGKALADEEALLSARALLKELPTMAPNAQRLAPEPRGIDADDALSSVAYDKGSWFLRTLETRFGRETFDNYLKGYFAHFAFQSITTEQMLDYLKANLFDKNPGKMSWDEVKAWVYQPGVPKNAPLPASPRFDAIDAARKSFLAGSLDATKLDAKGWNTQEWMYFLDGMPDVAPLDKLKALDAAWHLTGTPNAEIGMRWYSHAIAAGDKDVWNAAAEHMTRIGRLYLTMPLYKAFARTPDGLAFAKQVYEKAKSGYHPMTQEAVERTFAKAAKGDKPAK
ncbi:MULTISPECIES: M1 family metallopeptidase [Dyella]|uniref:Aminopeptidase N n=2 Tax=Dyella TaxID=231454 RepID=A0A4R0YPY8_9GAMM|nr:MULTISPECIES: M1 family metallopeptidase [Dyella]TBR36442.1 M1 family peptidase [Dyella terrae]TCI08466.1 M1 family peptidase [Dyella soli]